MGRDGGKGDLKKKRNTSYAPTLSLSWMKQNPSERESKTLFSPFSFLFFQELEFSCYSLCFPFDDNDDIQRG